MRQQIGGLNHQTGDEQQPHDDAGDNDAGFVCEVADVGFVCAGDGAGVGTGADAAGALAVAGVRRTRLGGAV